MKSHISKKLLFLLFLTLISILCSCNKAEKDTNQVDHSEIIYCNFLTYDLTPQIVEAPQSAADYCAEMFYDKNNTLLHCEIKNIDTDSVKHRVEYNHDGSISKYELYYYGTTCFTYEYNNDGLLTKINDS